MKVIFSTEQLNSYGFWVATLGIGLDRFKKNPILLHDHREWTLPIGKVENIRIENNELVGDVTFDESDERGLQLKNKYEKGFMNAFSIGFEILELSDESVNLKQGQIRKTVTKCELIEISVVTIPSNANAVRLYKKGQKVELSNNNEINNFLPTINKSKMKKIALSLGLKEDATEEQVIEAVAKLKKESEKPADDNSEKYRVAFIELGKKQGLITEENKDAIEKLSKLDISSTMTVLSGGSKKGEKKEQKQVSITDIIEGMKGGSKTEAKKFNELSHSEIVELRKKPEEYKTMFKAHYGYEPKI